MARYPSYNVSRLPTGKSVFATKSCPALPAKRGRGRRRAQQFYQLAPSRPDKRGGSRVVTNAGWDAVDAAALARRFVRRAVFVSEQQRADERRCCVRQNRLVLAPVAGVKFAKAKPPDRAGLSPSSRGRRWQEEFVTEESAA